LSSYSLTVEPKTALEHFIKKEVIPPWMMSWQPNHFQILVDETSKAGFTHYETCSFGNRLLFQTQYSSYWLGKPYLGVGPSAHSFDGKKRSLEYFKQLKNTSML